MVGRGGWSGGVGAGARACDICPLNTPIRRPRFVRTRRGVRADLYRAHCTDVYRARGRVHAELHRARAPTSVFQLDIFLRALRPALTVLRPARLYSALPEFKKKKKNCCFCVFRQGCKNACRFVPMFSSIAHKIVLRARFVHVLDCDRILVIRALNCARLYVVRALNCARILVVRALDCAQFLLHPALFPT